MSLRYVPLGICRTGVLLLMSLLSLGAIQVTDLKCEYRRNPLGINTAQPRLSWVLRSKVRGDHQTAYRVLAASSPKLLKPGQADLWDSGTVPTSESIQIAYAGKPLASGQRVYWTVRVWDAKAKPSAHAAPAWFETALLSEEDWKASWISHKSNPADSDPFGVHPAPLMRKEFFLDKPIASARAYVSGLGYYEMRLNGKRVGDHVLEPGWTDYSKRVLYSIYDITPLLTRGTNVIGAMLGNGWYNPLPLKFWGRINLREHLPVGTPRFIAQVHLTFKDGSRQILCSDATWKTSEGPVLKNSIYLGETYDARKEQPGWDRHGFDDSAWQTAIPASKEVGALTAQQAPPIRVTRTLKAVKLTEPKPGVYIFDLGQNFAGWVRLKVKGPAGSRIQLRYGELLYDDGTLNGMTAVCGQIKTGGPNYEYDGTGYPQTAWQQDVYILKGSPEGEIWVPRFTFHGFRYVEVKGLPGKPTLNTIEGLRLNSDVGSAGRFECSNPLFNRIQEMVLWTELSNLFSVQSDCPHREKFGYGGDIVVSSEMGLFNFDMAQFYSKAVTDLADAVRPNGGFTETAPFVGISDEGLGQNSGPIGWGSGHPVIQAQLHQYYGERRLLEQEYTNTMRWVALLKQSARDGILENGLSDHEGIAPKPKALTGTGFYYLNVKLAAHIAQILGRPEAQETEKLAQEIKAAFNQRFLQKETGQYDTGTQACQAFALYLGLVPEEHRAKALDVLRRDILEKNKGHLTTGIFGTKFMLNALTEANLDDVAYTIVNQKDYPGWGHMVLGGATTLWEHWAFSDNTYSHNHPMFGSVSEWFYKSLAGIQPASDAVGFNRVLIRPPKISDLDWANGSYTSIRGPISSRWRKTEDAIELHVQVPPGVTAQVWVPAESPQEVTESGRAVTRASEVQFLKAADGYVVLQCGSGAYKFRSRIQTAEQVNPR